MQTNDYYLENYINVWNTLIYLIVYKLVVLRIVI